MTKNQKRTTKVQATNKQPGPEYWKLQKRYRTRTIESDKQQCEALAIALELSGFLKRSRDMDDYLAVLLATIKSYQDQTLYLEEWMQLVRECPLRRIYTDDYYKLAKKMAATLTARAKRSRDAQEYLVVLTDIIKSYEDIYHPQQLLPDDQQLSKLLSYYRGPLGKPTRVRGVRISAISKVLAGTRKLTSVELEEISKLFTISAKAFQPRES